jgi:hypothetical protein
VLISRHSKVSGRVNSKARNGTNDMKKIGFTKNPALANIIDSVFSSETCFGTEFREFASIFVPRNGIPSWFLFRGLVQNGIPRVSFLFLFHGTEFITFFSSVEYFGTEFREFSVPRNSRNSAGTSQLFCLFSLPRNNFFVGSCQP